MIAILAGISFALVIALVAAIAAATRMRRSVRDLREATDTPGARE